MTDSDARESITRETLWLLFRTLLEEVELTTEEAVDAVYWEQGLSPEHVERIRQAIYELEYATEEYLAPFCEETESWADETERSPSWLRGERDEDSSDQ